MFFTLDNFSKQINFLFISKITDHEYFNVAVSEKIKDSQDYKTTWFRCARFANNVSIAPYLKKGTTNEDLFFLYLQTYGYAGNLPKTEWTTYLKKAKNMNGYYDAVAQNLSNGFGK